MSQMSDYPSDYFHDLVRANERIKDVESALAAKEKDSVGYREAVRLAEVIWRSCYQREAPQWQVLDTTAGVISQIDNMFAGMRERAIVSETALATATAQLQMFSDFAGGEIYMSDFQTATQMRERVNELQAQLAETKRELASRPETLQELIATIIERGNIAGVSSDDIAVDVLDALLLRALAAPPAIPGLDANFYPKP